jgi:hypothetical protein
MRPSSGDSSNSGRVGRVHSAAIQPSARGSQQIVSIVAVASLTPSIPTEHRFTRSISPAERCFSRSCSTQILCSVSHRSLLSCIERTKRCSTQSVLINREYLPLLVCGNCLPNQILVGSIRIAVLRDPFEYLLEYLVRSQEQWPRPKGSGRHTRTIYQHGLTGFERRDYCVDVRIELRSII